MSDPHENLEKNASEEEPQEGETVQDAAEQQTETSKDTPTTHPGPTSTSDEPVEGDGH
ncbi:hypothetical protein BRM3_03960 [Brachybacterium huguangmaarense]|uniref:Uncharacterized protein n=1 Tax=Brachybacterium huguangmaarense TaxID=1652028 RepID=A0ABY6G3A2_9MICO|nr:hypothetical protein [Brachybacterium huguangmaarense]UYG17597.1 hypothetical protein BRM3_03960 [Brachybacterium huguangmaarense]